MTAQQNPHKKAWYKTFWGIIVILLFWPIAAVWATWKKTSWPVVVKSIITGVIGILLIAGMIAPSEDDTNQKTPTDVSLKAEVAKENKTVKENKPVAQKNTELENDNENEVTSSFITAQVVRIVDGDTIEVLINGKKEKVRFIGVDTPETKHPSKPVEDYGKEASHFTEMRLNSKKVWLELGVQKRDKYDRTLAYVWLEKPNQINDEEVREKQFNAQLLLGGYAQLLTIPPDVKYANDYYVEYQKEARGKQAGLWRAPSLTTTTAKDTADQNKAISPESKDQSLEDASNSDVIVYITDMGKKYHLDGCSSLRKSKHPISLQDAIIQGYEPCKNCDPPR